nr:EOG090X0D3U [Sida crystallina]
MSNQSTPTSSLTEEIIQNLSKGDKDIEKKLKLIEYEYEVMKQSGANVPSQLKPAEWDELLQQKFTSGRGKYLRFLFINEKRRAKEAEKKAIKQKSLEECRKARELESGGVNHFSPHIYGIAHNTITLRVYDTKIENTGNWRCIRSIMYGIPLVFDIGFHSQLCSQELKNTAKQLMLSFGINRDHVDPFNLHFVNYNSTSKMKQYLDSCLPTLHEPHFPINVSSQSYLDLFPKEKLVYLTPHTNQEMEKFDPDKVYIIGGIVDLKSAVPLTLAKAKREGIATAKLPLERYMAWGLGSKCLTLDTMMKIMLEMKTSGSWENALKHIPIRKLKTEEELLQERSTQV